MEQPLSQSRQQHGWVLRQLLLLLLLVTMMMMMTMTTTTAAFVPPSPTSLVARRKHVSLTTSLGLGNPREEDEKDKDGRKKTTISSRIEGNQREPTEQEIAVLDAMIGKLLNAEPYELPGAVQKALRVIRSPKFFLRLAQLADKEIDTGLKERYGNLAQNLVATLDAVLSLAQEQLDDVAVQVQTIVKAAAEPESGEFYVPLTRTRWQALRTAFRAYDDDNDEKSTSTAAAAKSDEAFLSTIDAWMNKAHSDGMEGMVVILQQVLQLYAARRLTEQIQQPSPLLSILLDQPPSEWATTLQQQQQLHNNDDDNNNKEATTTTITSIVREIQRHMEAIILSLETGSMAQKVQAEFLREMVRVAEQQAGAVR